MLHKCLYIAAPFIDHLLISAYIAYKTTETNYVTQIFKQNLPLIKLSRSASLTSATPKTFLSPPKPTIQAFDSCHLQDI